MSEPTTEAARAFVADLKGWTERQSITFGDGHWDRVNARMAAIEAEARREAQAAGDQAPDPLRRELAKWYGELDRIDANALSTPDIGVNAVRERVGHLLSASPVQPAAAPRETVDAWTIVAALPLFPGSDGAAGVTTSIGTAAALRRHRESVLTALHVAVAPAAASAEPREETEYPRTLRMAAGALVNLTDFVENGTSALDESATATLKALIALDVSLIGKALNEHPATRSAAPAELAGEVMSEQCGFRSSVSPQRCYLPSGHAADSPTRFHRFAGPEKWLRDELMILPMLESRREILLALLDDALAEARVR